MSIIGSSSILATGSTGSIGPIGPQGNTGNTGPDATGCGELTKGNTASYISSVTQTKNPWGNLIFGLNDGSTVEFNAPSIIGATLSSFYGVRAITLGSDSLFAGITQTTAGLTFQFKTITSSVGALSVKNTADQIVFNSSLTPYNATGFTSAELVYFSSITGSNRLAGITLAGSTFFRYKNNNYFDLNTVISSKTNIVPIPSATRGSSGEYIDVSKGGLFYINTPNGIMGFTGISGAPGTTGTIQSITLITQSDYIWKFPENVWFEANNNYLGCGETVIGLTTKNNGENWTATIFGRGFKNDPTQCQSDWDIGSCYQGISCNNYVYRADCEAAEGQFCLEACSVETEIFDAGSCCINGVCRDGVSKFLCTKYGGRWWSPEQTGPDGCNAFECWDPCLSGGGVGGAGMTGSCCVGATCLDRHTESECEMLNGNWRNSPCSPTSCNPLSGVTGACCVNKDTCVQATYQTCIDVLEGIFVGIGETCGAVNCDCFTYTSSAIGCNSNVNRSGVAFSEQKIDLSSLNWIKSEGISQGSFCFSYIPNKTPDRWLILKTKDTDSGKQFLIRGSEDARYKSDYKDFIVESSHPWYSDKTSYAGAILFDTGCTWGEVAQRYRKTVTVTENDVEIDDTTDFWYKKIRLWNLAGCNSEQQNFTNWSIGISCGDCPPSSQPSTQLPSINNAISTEHYINSNVTYTLWQPNYALLKNTSDTSSPKYPNLSTTNPPNYSSTTNPPKMGY